MIKTINMNKRESFQLIVDGVPYLVTASPFDFNGEVRFRVRCNRGEDHIFTWDSSVGRIAAIDDDSSVLPDSVEQAIAEKLQILVT
jgi:hypothetical protein